MDVNSLALYTKSPSRTYSSRIGCCIALINATISSAKKTVKNNIWIVKSQHLEYLTPQQLQPIETINTEPLIIYLIKLPSNPKTSSRNRSM